MWVGCTVVVSGTPEQSTQLFLTAELNFSELKLVPISSRTRKYSCRMRTARLPTVSNCIPGPMSGGQYPPRGHTHPQKGPGTRDTNLQVEHGTRYTHPTTEWLTATYENITFLQLHWRTVIKCCCNWLFTCYRYLRWRILQKVA